MEQALEMALEKKDPKKKLERRLAKEGKGRASKSKPCPGQIPEKNDARLEEREGAKSRYIPSEVRERVFARAAYRCEFVARDGTRRRARAGLHIDHISPFAIFHTNDESQLRALCSRHNRFTAERVYGAEYIRDKIEQRRKQRPARARPG